MSGVGFAIFSECHAGTSAGPVSCRCLEVRCRAMKMPAKEGTIAQRSATLRGRKSKRGKAQAGQQCF